MHLVQTKAPAGVRQMFHDIAPTYDRLNHLLSLNIDRRWRAITAKRLIAPGVGRVLDVCSGTGDLALAFVGRAQELGLKPRIFSSDFTPAMCRLAQKKFEPLANRPVALVADTTRLPFADNAFDLVSVAFGIRNVADLGAGLGDMVRVCRPGGTVAVLEFSHPRVAVVRQLYLFYFLKVLPMLGRLISGTRAYTYLPNSVRAFPDTEEFTLLLKQVAGGQTQAHRLTFGIATLYMATVQKA